VAVDTNGNVYVADSGNNTIRLITPVGTNWLVSTIAGSGGNYGSSDGVGTAARFNLPSSVAVDSAGNVYVADTDNNTIRKVTPAGVVTTIAGVAGVQGSADGTGSAARFWGPQGVTVDSAGNLYVADWNNDTIRIATPVGTNWVVTTIAGQAGIQGSVDGTGSAALFNSPVGVAVDTDSNVYVADTGNNTIRTITSAAMVSTIAGAYTSSGSVDGTGNAARFNYPHGVAVGRAGNVFVADMKNCTIRKVTPAGAVTTVAGQAGNYGSSDGVGTAAMFSEPCGVAVDTNGNVYVADSGNNTIRKVTPAGVVTTLAGLVRVTGTNDGTGSSARFYFPESVAVDSADNVYVADTDNNTIRKVTPAGVVTTIAGVAGTPGSVDGTGSAAQFWQPQGVAVDNAGNVYVADTDNNTIRKITLVGTNWVVSTIAGLAGNEGSADGVGTFAQFYFPLGVSVDNSGNVYVADTVNKTIRKITPLGTNWVVSTIAGSAGNYGSADGVGTAARFNLPSSVAVDSAGNVYVTDSGNNTIREGVFMAYGEADEVAYCPPAMNSSLTVWLQPTNANGQWRFPWEVAWHNSGYTETNLVAGNYSVEFCAVPGYLVIPFSGTVGVTNNTVVTNQYYPTIGTVNTNNGGTLTVTLGPNPPSGAYWGFLGQGQPSFPSGFSTNLVAGTYLITFATVSSRVTPPNLSVQVQTGQPTYLSENYQLAQSAPNGVLLPTPVPSANISDLTDYPFGFNGQLESDVGYGSGVAVEANVVLTAAHLVFNDQTLSYVSQAYWYFQEETGVFQPQPIAARGWYVLSGYAAQRTNDMEIYAPGTYTPQAANLDVAALYFSQPVAGGGYGGYLPSDASPNTWLTSTAEKMLVGYPVDGSQFGNTVVPGQMYQTEPQPYPLAMSTDPVSGQQEVYTASWFLGYPGDSGGPVYVELNGYYYPAGVYLATLYNGTVPYASAVRAIDSEVVNLITNAAVLGDSGTNNSGGGVITIIPNQAINAQNPGYVQLQLAPPAAVAAGAGWRLEGDTTYSTATNYTEAVLSTNAIGVQFKPIAGWNLPTNQTVTVYPQQIVTPVAFYTVSNPVMVANESLGIGIIGTTGTVYEVESRTSLTSGSWVPVSTNTIISSGFNLVLPKPGTNNTTTFYRVVWLGQ
jgi:hypothetical protein